MARAPKLLVSAGEASGDRLGAGLVRAIRRRRPDIEVLGMGGAEMAAAGVRLVARAEDVAVVGLVEVLSHLPAIRAAMAALDEALAREEPDLLVPIDFPEFNLKLAAKAKRAGVPIVYFVSPQIWAWRRGRIRKIRDLVRRMLVLLPFEAAFYEESGVPVTFVGHPAIDATREAPARDELLRLAGLSPGRPVVALLPGSRVAEVRRLLPRMMGAVRRLRTARPELQVVVPRASTIPAAMLDGIVARSGVPDVRVVTAPYPPYPEILTACAAGAVASGTATLDAALAELPMVVVYRVHASSSILARLLVRVDRFSLPNLIAGEAIVPELFQGAVTEEAIAAELARYLDSAEEAERVREGLRTVRRKLGPPGVIERAADAVIEELDRAKA
jgi:lipid-A-disaccharide synthase